MTWAPGHKSGGRTASRPSGRCVSCTITICAPCWRARHTAALTRVCHPLAPPPPMFALYTRIVDVAGLGAVGGVPGSTGGNAWSSHGGGDACRDTWAGACTPPDRSTGCVHSPSRPGAAKPPAVGCGAVHPTSWSLIASRLRLRSPWASPSAVGPPLLCWPPADRFLVDVESVRRGSSCRHGCLWSVAGTEGHSAPSSSSAGCTPGGVPLPRRARLRELCR